MVFTVLLAVSITILSLAFYLWYESAWGRTERARRELTRQGISGPSPSFLYGNIPEIRRMALEHSKSKIGSKTETGTESDYGPSIFPHFERWRSQYGSTFLFFTGNIPMLYVSHPNFIKEVSQYKALNLGRPTHLKKDRGALLGHGILSSNGSHWAHQRKVIAPEFFMEKVKAMVSLMVEVTIPLLELWEDQIERDGKVVVVDEDLRNFSADVISRACFGSSYSKGKAIFSKIRDLQKLVANVHIGIPWMRYLPTKSNREVWRLEKEIRFLILNIVNERKEMTGASHQNDLLQSLLDNSTADLTGTQRSEDFIVDNCKNIYFAGHETTAISAAWCLLLLAKYPDWQASARAEVLEILDGGQSLDFDKLKRMKILTMVIQETLRLYSPAVSGSREALEDIKLGNLLIPRGTGMWIPIPTLHHDPEIWGDDVNSFNPERFSRGISGACKVPHGYIPFGLGPRTCLGQNFAMIEMKVVLSLILAKFTFTLSPDYRHSPVFQLVVEPEFGVPLVMKRL